MNKTAFQTKIQLYRAQFVKIFKESRFIIVKNYYQETEMKKIDIIYEEMKPYHKQIE